MKKPNYSRHALVEITQGYKNEHPNGSLKILNFSEFYTPLVPPKRHYLVLNDLGYVAIVGDCTVFSKSTLHFRNK